MSYSKNRKKQYPTSKKYPLGLLLPLIALLAVIPLITFMYSYNTNLGQFEWYTALTETVDFFLYYKMVWIIIACVYIIFCLVYLFFVEEKNFLWIRQLIPLGVYCGISLVSALASKYSSFSFHGIFEQFEPVWILIGYGIMAYYAFYIMHDESALKRTMDFFLIGIAVMCAIGLTQVFRVDFFRSPLGQRLITPSTYTGGPLQFTFEIGRPYMTLYNPNYIGFYACLVLPVLLALILAVQKTWYRIVCAVLMAAMMLILFASQSRSGILVVVVILFIMLLCMRQVFLRYWKIGLAAVIVAVIGFFAINAMSQNVLLTRFQELFTQEPEYYSLKEIQTNDDNVTVVYQTPERSQEEGGKITDADSLVFHVTQDEEGADVFSLQDGTGKDVDFTYLQDQGIYSITDPRFPFTFSSVRDASFQGFCVTINDKTWYLSNLMKEGDSTYYCQGGAGAMMKLAVIKESIPLLDKHYKLANMRGYLWDRTIPLLKKYFFLGSGPDTFIIAFPNSDLVGLHNSGHVNEIITKPHCMYLQVGVQTGVLSLIALLIFFGWYLTDSFRLYWRCRYSEYMPMVGVGIFASVIGYLILCLTNDSCVAISPIFYTLIGIGLGINHKIRTDMQELILPSRREKASRATVGISQTADSDVPAEGNKMTAAGSDVPAGGSKMAAAGSNVPAEDSKMTTTDSSTPARNDSDPDTSPDDRQSPSQKPENTGGGKKTSPSRKKRSGKKRK